MVPVLQQALNNRLLCGLAEVTSIGNHDSRACASPRVARTVATAAGLGARLSMDCVFSTTLRPDRFLHPAVVQRFSEYLRPLPQHGPRLSPFGGIGLHFKGISFPCGDHCEDPLSRLGVETFDFHGSPADAKYGFGFDVGNRRPDQEHTRTRLTNYFVLPG